MGSGILTEVGARLWVAESPLRWYGIEIGRRMAVVQLANGGLFVHSPAPLSDALREELDALGEMRFVVPANKFHGHLYMEQYRAAYPQAELFAAPGLDAKRRDLRFDGLLGSVPDPRWKDEIDQAPFLGNRVLTEIVFFHQPSRTLILGDVCLKLGLGAPLSARLYGRLAGVYRRLAMPRELRLFVRNRQAACASVRRILEWDFDRILVGHDETVETGGREDFRRAFALLGT